MTPKKKPIRKKQHRVDLDAEGQANLRKCTKLKLDDPSADYRTSPTAVVGWALRKCAAEATGG